MVAIYILRDANHWIQNLKTLFCIQDELDPGGGGGTLGISGWDEPLGPWNP